MWCYRKPGFEALLLTELQRQQQCSQFCDTLLKAEGVSVPAHSCILSAISPHFSSALSSSPVPAAGQSRLLEFQALGACTLLHIIRLLYSGEMAGEGETEKQQAIYAAAKLGISGLVEVKKSKAKEGGGVTGGQYAEVGVQTEENEGGDSKWRREVRDGSTYLWKETLSDGGKDILTQTEEMQVNLLPPVHPAASFETIDMGAFQSLGQTNSHQFVPITIVYPPDENQTVLVPSDAPACLQETPACTSVSAVAPPYSSVPPSIPHCSRQTVPQSGWADPQEAGGDEEWENERIEQFDGNIAGFINYFLNPTKAEGPRGRRRAGRRPRGARGPGAGQQRARRPRGRTAGRGHRGFTQRVDVQEVGVGKLQTQFLHRWGTRTPRTGQGGGAVGRKLFLKEREVPPAARRAPSRRGRGKGTEVSQSRDPVLCSEGRGGNSKQGQENTPTQFHQVSPAVGRDRHSRAKSTPVSFPAPSKEIHGRPPLSASRSSLSDTLRSPAASCLSTASSILSSTRLPPPAPPTHENQPEHIDRLLEEVMMGLDILPKNNSDRAPHSESELPESSSSGGNTQSKQQGPTTDAEVSVLQQQCEGELSEMLETFLQSFEQHAESCNTRENEMGDGSTSEAGQPYTILSKSKRAETQTETPHTLQLQNKKARRPTNRPETSDLQNEGSELTKTEKNTRAKWSRRKTRNYLFSLEKRRMKKSLSSGDRKVKDQQIPAEEPETNGLLPVQSCLQEKKTETRASTVKSSRNGTSENFCQENGIRKCYPIRSRFREAQITQQEIMAFLEVPLPAKPSEGLRRGGHGRRGRPRTRQPLSSSNGESTPAPVHPQPADSCRTDDPSESNQDRNEDDLTAQPQEESEGPTGSGQKRANEDTSEEAAAKKRICFDQSERLTSSPEPAELVSSTEQEEVIDVETVSLTAGLRSCFLEAKQEDEQFMEESLTGEEVESSHDEAIDVEGDQEDAETPRWEVDHNHLWCLKEARPVSPSHPAERTSPERTENCDEDLDEEEDLDEDIDVIGGSSPAPSPVIISWTESFEDGEEAGEEVDVVGETMDCISSFILAAVRKRELDYGKTPN